jgi:hypothetical protein
MWLPAEVLFAQVQTGTLVLLSVVGLTVAVLLVRSQRGLRPQNSPPVSRLKQPALTAAPRRTPRLAEQARGDAPRRDPAEEPHAELDGKMHELQQLVRAGEALALRLESLLDRTERAIATDRLPPRTESARETPPRSFVHPPTQAAALTVAAQTAVARPCEVQMDAPTHARRPAEPQQRFDEIYALADAGCDSATIAGITGSPIGEVELILSLRE